MQITFPTLLTCARIALIPFIGVAMVMHSWILAIFLFLIAAATDVLDGHLARSWGQESYLGACLDPLADKLLIITCYSALVLAPIEGLMIPTWFLIVVLAKEALLLLGAFYLGIMQQEVVIKATVWGKMAMVAQSILIAWLLACSIFHWVPVKTFNFFLAAALALVVGSLVHYAWTALAGASSGIARVFWVCVTTMGAFLIPLFLVAGNAESFLAEPKPHEVIKEKKYSEICDELFESYESYLHALNALLRTIIDEQEACMGSIKKLAENCPKMARAKLIKDLKRVKKNLKIARTCAFL